MPGGGIMRIAKTNILQHIIKDVNIHELLKKKMPRVYTYYIKVYFTSYMPPTMRHKLLTFPLHFFLRPNCNVK